MNDPKPSFAAFRDALQAGLRDTSLRTVRQQVRRWFSPELAYGRHSGPPTPDAKPAAVMILLEPRNGQWTIPLTVRPNSLPDHPGQICFPGGRLEAGEKHLAAAEREFAEEMGTDFPGQIVGELHPIYVFRSNYYVRPFVAVVQQSLQYRPCPNEVSEILHLPASYLLDFNSSHLAEFSRAGLAWRARAIAFQSREIWGATAILLGELSVVLREVS